MKKDILEKLLNEKVESVINIENDEEDLDVLIQEIVEIRSKLKILTWLETHEDDVIEYFKERYPYIEGENLPIVRVSDMVSPLESITFNETETIFKFRGIEFNTPSKVDEYTIIFNPPSKVDEYTIIFNKCLKSYSSTLLNFNSKDTLQIRLTFNEQDMRKVLKILGYK